MTGPADRGIVVVLRPDEVELLLHVVDDVEALVADPGLAGADVARRLVPEAHRDDPDAEADYRSVVGPQLKEERAAAVARMREGLTRAGAGQSAGDATAAVDAAVTRAVEIGLEDQATSLRDLWRAAAPGSDVRERVVDELARLCDRGARMARRRGNQDLAGSLAAAGDDLRSSVPGTAGAIEVVLGGDDVEAWMITVNHARLAIGTVCGVTEELQEWHPEDPRTPQIRVYNLLTALLDHLVEATG